ncbi:unnamed protein product [Brachionus calyciflorus]|uniref:EF-hand domain-containing protein n=1 Tax=Brachionus calyciflorus TaxID=104777 RepID=A0A813V6N3_9BILA|nr:unnamed protein product [Brachionus calyciflorus]
MNSIDLQISQLESEIQLLETEINFYNQKKQILGLIESLKKEITLYESLKNEHQKKTNDEQSTEIHHHTKPSQATEILDCELEKKIKEYSVNLKNIGAEKSNDQNNDMAYDATKNHLTCPNDLFSVPNSNSKLERIKEPYHYVYSQTKNLISSGNFLSEKNDSNLKTYQKSNQINMLETKDQERIESKPNIEYTVYQTKQGKVVESIVQNLSTFNFKGEFDGKRPSNKLVSEIKPSQDQQLNLNEVPSFSLTSSSNSDQGNINNKNILTEKSDILERVGYNTERHSDNKNIFTKQNTSSKYNTQNIAQKNFNTSTKIDITSFKSQIHTQNDGNYCKNNLESIKYLRKVKSNNKSCLYLKKPLDVNINTLACSNRHELYRNGIITSVPEKKTQNSNKNINSLNENLVNGSSNLDIRPKDRNEILKNQLRKIFLGADRNRDGLISYAEVQGVLIQLNKELQIPYKPNYIFKFLKQAQNSIEGFLNLEEFCRAFGIIL